MITHTNRHGDMYTFTKQDDGNILWEGSFQFCRVGTLEGKIEMVDPSGGPYLQSGQDTDRISSEFKGGLIKEFRRFGTGYEIILW
jgi:hypothetical protein